MVAAHVVGTTILATPPPPDGANHTSIPIAPQTLPYRTKGTPWGFCRTISMRTPTTIFLT